VTNQLQLKVLWLKNSLGLSIDNKVLNQTYSLTQYYFWPKTEAWDQLKLELETKYWLSKLEKVRILNLTTEVMNQWRKSQSIDSFEAMATKFAGVNFVKFLN
jgi:30S ribosomal protein 3